MKDLESQIQRREKQNQGLGEDVNKARDKIGNLLQTIDELQSSDGQSQLAAKRAERELREEREKALRLERELEGWKGLRVERGGFAAVNRSGTMIALNEMAKGERRVSRTASGRVRNRDRGGVGDGDGEGGLKRAPSNTKGFL